MLYELLTGSRPYRIESLGWEESARIICEAEPVRPSTATRTLAKVEDGADAAEVSGNRGATPEGLHKRLRGDLDNIIGMALRKEPLRRYRSVDQFSEDLQRHLDGRPVMARADSTAYRARKFARRHWFGVAVGVLFAVVVTAAAVLFGWQNARLSRRVDADQALTSSFLVDVHDAIAKLPGSTPAREMLVERSLKYLNELARDAGGDQDMNAHLALGYEKFAELQAGVNSAGLGQSTAALETYRKSQALRETMVRSLPRDRKAQYDLAGNYLLGAFIAGRAGGADAVLRYNQKAVALSEVLVRAEPGNHDYQVLLGKAYMGMAYGETLFERWSNADVYFEKASKIRERLAAADPRNLDLQRDLGQHVLPRRRDSRAIRTAGLGAARPYQGVQHSAVAAGAREGQRASPRRPCVHPSFSGRRAGRAGTDRGRARSLPGCYRDSREDGGRGCARRPDQADARRQLRGAWDGASAGRPHLRRNGQPAARH